MSTTSIFGLFNLHPSPVFFSSLCSPVYPQIAYLDMGLSVLSGNNFLMLLGYFLEGRVVELLHSHSDLRLTNGNLQVKGKILTGNFQIILGLICILSHGYCSYLPLCFTFAKLSSS